MMLEVKRLRREFGGLVAVKDVSFHVRPNEIKALIGPNGAGKTTTFNLISGALEPTGGQVIFQGRDITRLKDYQISRLGIVRTFQNIKLFKTNNFTVLDNVLVGYDKFMKNNVFTSGLGLRSSRRQEAEARERALEVVEMVGIQHLIDTPVQNLSYGNQRLVELARALISKPTLLLLDEPAAGLNDTETKALAELLLNIRDQLGITILLIEHHMGLVMNISDSIVVMNYGEKIAEGTPEEIKHHPQVIQAYLGEEAV